MPTLFGDVVESWWSAVIMIVISIVVMMLVMCSSASPHMQRLPEEDQFRQASCKMLHEMSDKFTAETATAITEFMNLCCTDTGVGEGCFIALRVLAILTHPLQ
jgi:hypothetical protein